MGDAPRHRGLVLVGTLVAGLAPWGCSDGGGVTPPGIDDLTAFQRAVIEEVAADRIHDLSWVAGSTGGSFPHLAYALGLPGVDAGILEAATVDPDTEPGLYDPFCTRSVLEDLRRCTRIRVRADGDFEFQSYYVRPPAETPGEGTTLSYAGEAPVATVEYRPGPLRVWRFGLADGGAVTEARTDLEERFTVTDEGGAALEVTVEGSLEADLEPPEVLRADLSLAGASPCTDLRVAVRRAHDDGDSGGEILCGNEVWADLVWTPGEPVTARWRE